MLDKLYILHRFSTGKKTSILSISGEKSSCTDQILSLKSQMVRPFCHYSYLHCDSSVIAAIRLAVLGFPTDGNREQW